MLNYLIAAFVVLVNHHFPHLAAVLPADANRNIIMHFEPSEDSLRNQDYILRLLLPALSLVGTCTPLETLKTNHRGVLFIVHSKQSPYLSNLITIVKDIANNATHNQVIRLKSSIFLQRYTFEAHFILYILQKA